MVPSAPNQASAGSRDSRRLILEAAQREFAHHGFAGGRVGRIAASAQVNKQLIFYYFGSKRGLFEAVVQTAAEQFLGSLPKPDSTRSPAEQLQTYLTALHRAAERAGPLMVHLLLRADGPAGGAVFAQIVRQVASIVSVGQGLGFFRDDVDPQNVAAQAVVLIFGGTGFALSTGLDRASENWPTSVTDTLRRALSW